MEKYCNNCGNEGHYYRECRYPIMSYGIILYDDSEKENIKIVLIERKNTLSYIEFLRGKYDINNNEYIQLLFDRMNNEEKNLILNHEFDFLWNNLWVNLNNLNNRIKKEYVISKKYFNILQKNNINNFKFFFDNSENIYNENEWEIPKGRRNNKEKNKSCAIREFQEETNVSPDKYKIFNNVIPLIEEYTGFNGVNHKHVYYIAKINEYEDVKINPNNENQNLEVKSIKWYNKDECLEKIRDYSNYKKDIIKTFFLFIENISEDNIKKI